MRFFSNDAARDNTSDTEVDERDDTEPAAVPHQRAGSPWSDAPADDLQADDSETRHDGDDLVRDADAPEAHDQAVDLPLDDRPAPTTTTYGPDGTVIDSADTDSGYSSDGTAAEDSALRDEGGFDSPTVVEPTTGEALDPTGEDSRSTPAGEAALEDEGDFDSPTAVEPATGEALDSPREHSDDEAHVADEEAPAVAAVPVEAVAGDPVFSGSDASGLGTSRDGTSGTGTSEYGTANSATSDSGSSDLATSDSVSSDYGTANSGSSNLATSDSVSSGYGTASSAAVGSAADNSDTVGSDNVNSDTVGSEGLGSETVRSDTAPAGDVAPVAAATDTGAKPGTVDAPTVDRLFTDGDSFAERFRDIQLRFVDSPKEATADAADLVGSAIDQLANSLKSQKDALAGNSDDTERLRVELRGYRDMLNRLSSL